MSRDLGRTSGDLTEAEKRELRKPCPYKYPVRLICGPMRAVTREARESFRIHRAKHVVELVPPNPEDRVVKMRKFFDAFWNDHCESGLYDAWSSLGQVLMDADQTLWEMMNRDAVSLPFHARPEVRRSEAGRFMSCRAGGEQDPFTLIRNLLIDGRSVYRVVFDLAEPTPMGVGVHPAVVYLNLPLNHDEKNRLSRWPGESHGNKGRIQPAGGCSSQVNEGKNRRARTEPEPEEFQEVGTDCSVPPCGFGNGNGRGGPTEGGKTEEVPQRNSGPTGPAILYGSAFGMTEPPSGEPSAASVCGSMVAVPGGLEPKKHTLFAKLEWDLQVGDRMPTFAPAAALAGNPRGLAGARCLFLSNARQSLASAASIIRRVKKGGEITLFAYSFDHPTVTTAIVEAVFRGVDVSLYADYGYVCGDSFSVHCKRTLIDALRETARASWPGRLRVFSQTGSCVKTAYARYDRTLSRNVGLGNSHAKLLYAHPYLMIGSTNWTVASESNLELSVLLEIMDRETKEYVESELEPMVAGAVQQSVASISATLRTPPR